MNESILMDGDLLRVAVVEQNTKDKTRRVPKTEGINFDEVLQLHVEYKDVLNIDSLWGFTSLTKLELNNNCIRKIEGLDCLIHLEWLNLSFNKIERIEGLDCLQKLEYLNLTSNRISVIENMSSLEELKLFSIARNRIDRVETVLHLRKLKHLRTLNVSGNPLLIECDYKLFIAAHFPSLMYLDHRVLTQETKEEAALKYLISIEKIKSKEKREEVERREEAQLQLHKDAFVDFLNGSHLFKEMFKDDPEVDQIHNIPGVMTLVETFGKEMVESCTQIFQLGLTEHGKREEEVKLFFRRQTETENHCQHKAAEILGKFEQQQQKMALEMQQISDSERQELENHQISVLQKELTALEFELFNQLENNAKKFDSNMTEMVCNFSETVQGIFAQCRDLENNYYKQVQEVAPAAVEAAAQDALEDVVLEDFRETFLDKELLMDALATSHDNHLTKINDRESELMTRLNAWKVTLIKKIQDDAQRWNSTRISDIERYVDYLRKQTDSISEPILMDEEILRTVVVEQSTKDQMGRLSKADDIMSFDEVLELRMAYKNILNIDNLWEFTSMTKIELNNNCIKKIEGLDRLVHLQWLNLSFNSIERIGGLNTLRKLEFLNLTGNKIRAIENMDSLEKLSLLSIAFNCIDKFETVLYLRKLKSLKTLNIIGNPFPATENYKLYIAAHFPNLMYLDYRTLTEKAKNEAFLKYQVAIEKINSKEQLEDAEHRQEAELQLHRDAFVEYLNGSYLYKDMLKDDPEADKIYILPGVASLLDSFESKFVDFCNQMFHLGLAEHRKRERELNMFLRGQHEAEKHYQQIALETLAEFEHRHLEMKLELQQIDDPVTLKTKFEQYTEEINTLQKNLMALEFQMVSQLEEIIEKFDINMSEIVSHFRDSMQSIFAQCRDLEDSYYKQVVGVAVAALEAASSDGLEDVLDDMRENFLDKEVLTDALANSHDNHLFKINDRETELVNRLNAWRANLMKKIQDDIQTWDSIRISDIESYVDYLKKQLEALLGYEQH